MAIVPMQKVAVLTHKSLVEDVLKLLQEAGVLEIIPGEKEDVIDHTEVRYQKSEILYLRDTLLVHAAPHTTEEMAARGSEEDVMKGALAVDYKDLLHRVKEIEEEKEKLRDLRAECEHQYETLLPWKHLPYGADILTQDTGRIALRPGTLPSDAVKTLRTTLQHELPRTELTVLPGENEKAIAAVAHVWKSDLHRFEEIATEYGWTECTIDLPEGKSADAVLSECAATLKEIEQREEILKKELHAMSLELPNIARLLTYIDWLDERQAAREAMLTSRDTATLLGWVPRNEAAILEAKLQNLSSATAMLKIKPDDGEEPPVLIRNKIFVTPFESVTTLYGLPLPSEMDPTAALSPFFILFFALCLTDAGYGLALALIFGIILWKMKPPVKEQPLLWLLFLSGIVTVIVSIPFGGWFGMTPEQAPDFATYVNAQGERLFLGQLWNLSSPAGITFFQNLAIGLGLTHLVFGMFLSGAHKWVHGQRAAAVWLDFTSHLLIGSVLLSVLAPASMKEVTTYALYAAIALFLWGKGYGHPWYLRPLFGVLGAANFMIGMLSNTLSYLRLLALGLVTGAIALAVNQVALEMGRLFPVWLGIPVTVIILLLGHLVSIALNTLGSFIHSGRLQFIEFFSQFFEGGGRQFQPFTRSLSS